MKSADLVRVMGGLLLLGMILFADLPTGLRLLVSSSVSLRSSPASRVTV